MTLGGVLNGAPTNYWPLTLYDIREVYARDNLQNDDAVAANRQLYLGGVMHYIELDVINLRLWIQGTIGAHAAPRHPGRERLCGVLLRSPPEQERVGVGAVETGEYGFEDHVNPADPNGCPMASSIEGEDVNDNALLDNLRHDTADTGGRGRMDWMGKLRLRQFLFHRSHHGQR